jgi:hypothetical protein
MKKVIVAGIAIVILIVTFFAWWHWRANYAEELFTMDIPAWMVDDVKPGARYQISIGKSQVNNYGTLWETTVSGNVLSSFPRYTEEQRLAAFRRWEKERGPVPPHVCQKQPLYAYDGLYSQIIEDKCIHVAPCLSESVKVIYCVLINSEISMADAGEGSFFGYNFLVMDDENDWRDSEYLCQWWGEHCSKVWETEVKNQ